MQREIAEAARLAARRGAGLAAILAVMASPVALAQTNPPEDFTVITGPSRVFHMHYADTLCGSQALANTLPASVSRTESYAQGGRTLAEIYTVYKPNVLQPNTVYAQIPINNGDRVLIYACGCVQTGGRGRTWKSYFDPKGPESGHLYSGRFGVIYSGDVIPPDFWKHPQGRRIKDYVAGQGPGINPIPGRTMSIVLGYEDDGYSDNGYSAHDDGTGDQCKGVGAAAVDVMIYHFGAH